MAEGQPEKVERSNNIALEMHNDERFADRLVALDGRVFTRCFFDRCTLSYSGGPSELTDCKWNRCTLLVMGGAAAAVLGLERLGLFLAPLPGVHLVVTQRLK
jgi:hypothetical protein